AILRLIKMVIEAGHKENIWVGMCGEMASEPAYALLLLGLGLDEFSTSMIAISEVKKIIRSVKYSDAKEIVEEALTLSTGKEVEDFAKVKLKKLVPGLFY
ncbi:MAG: phosphoenolpyruvate--protein phosphotransferase, partial [Candidatus Omnitrophica bacterium]|nr:phosphoenolpyruvate--protein phosphotransferase [Candidatus Omnitrophota bacterium]